MISLVGREHQAAGVGLVRVAPIPERAVLELAPGEATISCWSLPIRRYDVIVLKSETLRTAQMFRHVRSAIDSIYGTDSPVQRCRSHKVRNVLDQLPISAGRQSLNSPATSTSETD